ncbi:hypothetical protein EOL73_03475 [Candidatus Saccharibacteria bacterium]|nr:hypothetical protein [Candidatus Saccharibacteria bacterium]NCU40791.1 hypothetical protein [Candidatus Saccharibacteria bacterium]
MNEGISEHDRDSEQNIALSPSEITRRIVAERAFLGIEQRPIDYGCLEVPTAEVSKGSSGGSGSLEDGDGYTIHIDRVTGEWRIS